MLKVSHILTKLCSKNLLEKLEGLSMFLNWKWMLYKENPIYQLVRLEYQLESSIIIPNDSILVEEVLTLDSWQKKSPQISLQNNQKDKTLDYDGYNLPCLQDLGSCWNLQ